MIYGNIFKGIIIIYLNMSNFCNINFMSNYCFVNNNQIHVDDYIKTNNKIKILCQKGHELILVNGEKRRPHFRHKNSCDVGGNPMTLWHIEWQSHFPIIEVCFSCKPNQIKERRADVLLNEKKTLEIQHSKYEKEEIDNRKRDYQLHNIDIIWLIDGNKNIVVNFFEKVESNHGNLANGAVYILSKDLVNIIINNSFEDFSTQVIPQLMGKIFNFENKNIHIDIGNIESYLYAQSLK